MIIISIVYLLITSLIIIPVIDMLEVHIPLTFDNFNLVYKTKETKDAIVLIVAQRIGSIMDADKIIVLDEGKVVGVGKHKELLSTCNVYHEIALSQLTEEELA